MYLVCRLLLECAAAHRDLHSFPTRRSSDLWKAFGMFWGVSVLRSDQEKRPNKVFLSLICWSIRTLTWLSSRLRLLLLMKLAVVLGIKSVGKIGRAHV